MALTLPDNPTFSVGSSATTSLMAAKLTAAKVDMSLDDIIKTRQKESKTTSNKSKPVRRSTRPRRSVKSANKTQDKKPTNAQTSRGRSVAKKQAGANARRGLRTSQTPTNKETDNEVKRQQNKRQSNNVSKAPPKKAMRAAVSAMNDMGFIVPNGMKLVMNLEPKSPSATAPKPKNSGGQGAGKNNNSRKGKGGRGNRNN